MEDTPKEPTCSLQKEVDSFTWSYEVTGNGEATAVKLVRKLATALATTEAEVAGLVDRVVQAMQDGHETHFAAYVTNDEAFKLALEASRRLAGMVKNRFNAPSACTGCTAPCQKGGVGNG